jgi:hypothetical protein
MPARKPAARAPRRRARTVPNDGRPTPGRRTAVRSGGDPLKSGATTTVATGPAQDAVLLLQSEHRTLGALFDRAASDPSARAEIGRELDRHAALEEEVFHPAVAGASDEGASAVREARRHHADLRRAAAGGSDARALEALRALVERHVEFEERVIFAEAQRVLSKEALVGLAERMEQRNRDLGGTLPLARPRTGKPLEKVIRPKRV